MTDFFDWLTAADAGVTADRLAAQFRITPKEMRETTDALVPAFMLGIQRTMADPDAWTQLTRSFWTAAGHPSAGSAPPKEAGEALMRGLFGADLVHAIARQASLLTGQAPDTIERMMPYLGALTFQSMLQTMALAAARNPRAYPTDAAGHALAEAMRRSANALEAFSRPSEAAGGRGPAAKPMADVFADALKGGMPWLAMPSPAAGAAPPGDPFAFFSSMMSAFSQGAHPPAPAPPARKPAPPAPDGAAGPGDPISGFMAGAQSLQADYMREMLALFDRHRPAKD